MSDNQKYELYYENNNGEKILFDPKTVANAVKDETNNNSVQGFIDNPYKDDNENAEEKQYVSASAFKNWKQHFADELSAGFERILDYDNLIYCGKITLNNTSTHGFELIELPIKIGSVYKIEIEGVDSIRYNERIYTNGDYIVFIKYVDKNNTEWYLEDYKYIDFLGSSGSGLSLKSVISRSFNSYDDLISFDDFSDYIDDTKKYIAIVANDEIHNGLLSFYQYCENVENYINEHFPENVEIVQSYNDMLSLRPFVINPEFDYTLNQDEYIITLNDYISDNAIIESISYSESNNFKKCVKILDDNIYYKWNGYRWVFIANEDDNWVYLYSHEEDAKIIKNNSNLENKFNELFEDYNKMNNRLKKLENTKTAKIDVVNSQAEGNTNNTLYIIRQ